MTFTGSGSCKGFLIVTKGGNLVSSTAAASFSSPSKKALAFPETVGKYEIELVGNTGCLGVKATTEVNVLYARPTMVVPTRGR